MDLNTNQKKASGHFEKPGAVILAVLMVVFSGCLVNRGVPLKAQETPPAPARIKGSYISSAPAADTSFRRMKIDLKGAIDARTKLLAHSVNVHFVADGKELSSWNIVLKKNPSWVVFEVAEDGTGRAAISAERIKQQLIAHPVENVPVPESCDLLSSWVDEQGVNRVQTTCIAKSGYFYDRDIVVSEAKTALEQGIPDISIPLTAVPAEIKASDGDKNQDFKLLATGRSNFKGSGNGRKANVRKALNERLNNVYIPADTVFSFNSVLGKAVNVSSGWQMALTIFEGGNMRMAPGGGICQVSTTLYRAALQTGLPILAHKNHSLYVSYYEKYGVGQDATVFPGRQDLVFKNDTGGPLLIQSYNEGDEAYVNVYGTDDGREVTISGPYFSKTAPPDLLQNGRKVAVNEIVWIRSLKKSGSDPQTEIFSSRYQAIPRSLPDRYQPTIVKVRGSETVAQSEAKVVARE